MSDYISREAVLDYLQIIPIDLGYREIDDIEQFVKQLPAADVAPVVHGCWIQNDNGTWSCNRCHSWIPDEQHYYARFCLHCGAKMAGGDDNG